LNIARQQAQNGFRQRALAAARFAQDHHGAIGIQLEVNPVDGLHGAAPGLEMQDKVLDLK
jgi:hypothetical protein